MTENHKTETYCGAGNKTCDDSGHRDAVCEVCITKTTHGKCVTVIEISIVVLVMVMVIITKITYIDFIIITRMCRCYYCQYNAPA